MIVCPHCTEQIHDEAIVCGHCGQSLNVTSDLDPRYTRYAKRRLRGGLGEMGSWLLVRPFLGERRSLDIGCSDGLYLQHLSDGSVGIEQIPSLAEACRRKGLNVIEGDVMHVLSETPSESFEGAVFSHVMEHLERPIDALRKINRVLVDDGVLVVGLPTERNLFRNILRWDYFDSTHLYAFSIRNARRLLELTGFRVEQVIFQFPRLGSRTQRAWNAVRIPKKEWLSMAYWIVCTKATASD